VERISGLERARADRAADRSWVARDRLHGVFAANPTSQEVLELLGRVSFEMGDLPEAGRYWYLTETDNEEARLANAAFEKRFGSNPHAVVHSIPLKAPISVYPPLVQDRLAALRDAVSRDKAASGFLSSSDKGEWLTSEAKPRPKPPKPHGKVPNVVVGVLVSFTVGVWVIGVVTIVRL